MVDRLAGPSIPDHRRLALVGDADGRDVACLQPGARERGTGYLKLTGPDLTRVVLDPSSLGEDLLEFLLCAAADGAAVIKNDGSRTRRALVQCEDERHKREMGSL